jgi:Rrf2 family transcriptional regulator, iron-sulfur cluster assembly transcription factor
MQLTQKGDYAVRVMLDLAAQRAGASVRTTDLSRRTGVPRPYLAKVIQALVQAGLIRTQRGALGGVSLVAEPRTVTLRQVIEAVEGPIYLNRCLIRRGLCPRDRICPAHPVWARVQSILLRELDAVSIGDLTRPGESPLGVGR